MNIIFRTEKTIKSYTFYTKETIENRIYTMQKNCKVVLMKSLYDKASFEESENLLFNKKDYEMKIEKYV